MVLFVNHAQLEDEKFISGKYLVELKQPVPETKRRQII